MSAPKLLRKPLGPWSGVLGGMLAGSVLTRAWGAVRGSGEPPKPAPVLADAERGRRSVLPAAALYRGAFLSDIRTAVTRRAADLRRRVTRPDYAASQSCARMRRAVRR